MKIRVPSYYKEFKCIASACEDTCCAGWDVVIDAKTYQAYQNMDGAFGERLRNKMIVDKEGDNIFVLDGIRCPFLDKENLCDIHKNLGEQYLCHTCKQYPRYREEFFGLREMGISLSCPEAARIILRNPAGIEFELSEDSVVSKELNEGEEDILQEFFRCRETIFQILETKDMPLGIRAAIVLKFVQEIQDRIDFSELNVLPELRQKYEDSHFISELVQKSCAFIGAEDIKYHNVHAYFNTYSKLEHINSEDPLELNRILSTYWTSTRANQGLYTQKHKEFNWYYMQKMDAFEKILVYFVYRYFMKSFYDYDMLSKIKVALMSTIMVKELAVIRWIEKGELSESDMVDISHTYSKDIEHLEENIETLATIFETEDVYTVDKIIETLIHEF